ncbi:HDIG domain-containing protein [Dethiosulfatibacter aminovorans DSM 17477]|uniref:HDIG domain-containing protein n=1 Tax=Dethiosulfatibacter aminovorans DSM 17477 TaxID=1121476 RepID=A0A1M6FZ79_9FIRM|nr:HD-GYP domain-containing protein [Dethiosulfatibacter aminovorans]SHJ02980.1 HDIG domain-containing protein [Dethiosulfatibacter aminovorans DSM 17477]
MSSKVRKYITVVLFLAVSMVIYLNSNYVINNWNIVIIMGILSVIAETFMVKIPGIGGVSVAFAIVFSTIIMEGPLAGVIVSAIGITFCRPYVDDIGYVHILNTPIYKTVFNISQNILYAGTSALVYVYLHSRFYYLGDIDPVSAVGTMATFLFVNTLLMTFLIHFLSGGRFLDIWSENFKGMIVSVAAVGLLGIIIAKAHDSYGLGAVVMFFIPLMLSRYSFKLYVDMRANYYDTVKALINTIEAKDPYTSGHAARVGKYAVAIAKEMKLKPSQIDTIKNAALLHDIGKIGVNDNVLNKKERLTDEEFDIIKSHPSVGYDIIKDIGFLHNVMDIVKHHHERWDGTGYPDGLSGEDLPLETTILTVADSFDAMVTDRPYRKALSVETALGEIVRCAGTQFNPGIVAVSIKVLQRYEKDIESVNREIEIKSKALAAITDDTETVHKKDDKRLQIDGSQDKFKQDDSPIGKIDEAEDDDKGIA